MGSYTLLIASLILLQCLGFEAASEFKFANTYAPNMVLQAAPKNATILGRAKLDRVREEVKITVALAVDPDESDPVSGVIEKGPDGTTGVWKVVLPPIPAGGPYILTAFHRDEIIQLGNVMFGDVWICSGADNMVMETSKTLNGTEEMDAAGNYTNIRFITIPAKRSSRPLYDIGSQIQEWTIPSSEAVGKFSSLCWTYGRKLHEHTGKPVGLIMAAMRGYGLLQYWSSKEALHECRGYISRYPSCQWNGMIHPVVRMTITGVIWYQGESNAEASGYLSKYDCMFPAMVRDWRRKFLSHSEQTDPEFPFGFVQVAGCRENNRLYYVTYPILRWKQTAEKAQVPNTQLPNTFMAVAMDLDDFTSRDRHCPRDKTTVAERLMLGVRNLYLKEKVEHIGPLPTAYRFNPENYILEIQYSTTTLDYRSSRGFEVCCSDSLISPCTSSDSRWKTAFVRKADNTTITLSTSRCTSPFLLGHRYAWNVIPCAYKSCAVYSGESGLPGHMYIKNEYIRDDFKWHAIKF